MAYFYMGSGKFFAHVAAVSEYWFIKLAYFEPAVPPAAGAGAGGAAF